MKRSVGWREFLRHLLPAANHAAGGEDRPAVCFEPSPVAISFCRRNPIDEGDEKHAHSRRLHGTASTIVKALVPTANVQRYIQLCCGDMYVGPFSTSVSTTLLGLFCCLGSHVVMSRHVV